MGSNNLPHIRGDHNVGTHTTLAYMGTKLMAHMSGDHNVGTHVKIIKHEPQSWHTCSVGTKLMAHARTRTHTQTHTHYYHSTHVQHIGTRRLYARIHPERNTIQYHVPRYIRHIIMLSQQRITDTNILLQIYCHQYRI